MRLSRRAFTGTALGLIASKTAIANVQSSASFQNVEKLLSQWVGQGKLPNASILISHRGREVYRHHAGWSDVGLRKSASREDLFRIYSMTKPVTAALAMTFMEERRIRADDPVTLYVPEFAELSVWSSSGRPKPARTPMTIRHLLTHTSGLSYSFHASPVGKMYEAAGLKSGQWYHDHRFADLPSVARTLASIPLANEPGARWHYGMSLEIVGLILERVAARPLERLFAERIFQPLGMIDTGFHVPAGKAHRLTSLYLADNVGRPRLLETSSQSPFLRPPTVVGGSGGLISSLEDYACFASMLAGGGVYNGRRILTERAAKEMMRNHLPASLNDDLRLAASFGYGGSGEGMGFGYGGAVMIDTAPMGRLGAPGSYGWGGGASTTFWADPVSGLAVVFMTQLLPSGTLPIHDYLHRTVYGALLGGT